MSRTHKPKLAATTVTNSLAPVATGVLTGKSAQWEQMRGFAIIIGVNGVGDYSLLLTQPCANPIVMAQPLGRGRIQLVASVESTSPTTLRVRVYTLKGKARDSKLAITVLSTVGSC